MNQFDLIVIGGGAAGSSCAEKANQENMRVALIEQDALGGTCLNYGCDPTKAAIYSAKILHYSQQSQRLGLNIPPAHESWESLKNHLNTILRKMRGGSEKEAREKMRERRIDLFIGQAKFVSDHEIKIHDQTLWGENILIASGAEPLIPDIQGLDDVKYFTNKTIFNMSPLPEKLAIVGGGPVGVEFAQLFARLGSKVVLLEETGRILAKDEPELTAELAHVLEDEGVSIITNARLSAVTAERNGQQLQISFDNGHQENLRVNELLLALGRKPAVNGLNLQAAGVQVKDGKVETSETLQTNIPHIWSAGDVSSDYPFTHVAWRQGVHVAKNILNDARRPFQAEPIPWVTYTDPELAHVGRTEKQLKEAGVSYKVKTHDLESVARAVLTGQTQGQIKLILSDDEKILGGHILAPTGGEILGPIILAMSADLPISALSDVVWPYPTFSAGLGAAAAQQFK